MDLSTATLEQLEELRQAVKFTIQWVEQLEELRQAVNLKSSDKQGHLNAWLKSIEKAISDITKSERPPKTREEMIHFFTFDGKPYTVRYGILGRQRKDWLRQKPVLDEMIKAGEVSVVEKNRNSILYHYKG